MMKLLHHIEIMLAPTSGYRDVVVVVGLAGATSRGELLYHDAA